MSFQGEFFPREEVIVPVSREIFPNLTPSSFLYMYFCVIISVLRVVSYYLKHLTLSKSRDQSNNGQRNCYNKNRYNRCSNWNFRKVKNSGHHNWNAIHRRGSMDRNANKTLQWWNYFDRKSNRNSVKATIEKLLFSHFDLKLLTARDKN